jgi:hypothetical protein
MMQRREKPEFNEIGSREHASVRDWNKTYAAFTGISELRNVSTKIASPLSFGMPAYLRLSLSGLTGFEVRMWHFCLTQWIKVHRPSPMTKIFRSETQRHCALWYLRIHDCPVTSVTLIFWTQTQDKGIGTGTQDIGLVTCLLPCCSHSLQQRNNIPFLYRLT